MSSKAFGDCRRAVISATVTGLPNRKPCMLPAFFVLAAMNAGAPFWMAVLIGIALSIVVLGILFKIIIVDPMIKYGVLPLVISTIALSLFLKESAKDFYSSQAQPFPALVPATDIHFLDAVVSTQSLAVLAVAILTVIALNSLLNKTRLGRQMQATAQNPTLARILGIPVQRMVLYTFLLNAVLVAIASILVSPIYLAKFTNGETLGMLSWLLFYTSLFDVQKTPQVDINDPGGVVRSQVVETADGTLRIALNASQSPRTQSSRFLNEYFGSGVQHIAFATQDILATAASLRANGVETLRIPENYYDDLEARVDLDSDRLKMLKTNNVLYDKDHNGEYFQLYTKSFKGLFFLEIVQRRGYKGFGAINAPIRLNAQSRLAGEHVVSGL